MNIPEMLHGNPNQAQWNGQIFVAVDDRTVGVAQHESACQYCAFQHTDCKHVLCTPFSGRTDMSNVVYQRVCAHDRMMMENGYFEPLDDELVLHWQVN